MERWLFCTVCFIRKGAGLLFKSVWGVCPAHTPGCLLLGIHLLSDYRTFGLSYLLSFLFLSLGVSERSGFFCLKCPPSGRLQRNHSSFWRIIRGCHGSKAWLMHTGGGPLASPHAHRMIPITSIPAASQKMSTCFLMTFEDL